MDQSCGFSNTGFNWNNCKPHDSISITWDSYCD